MIADICDVVIGVDTHNDTRTFAVVGAKTGEVMEVFSAAADGAGYAHAVSMVEHLAPKCVRLWAIEGTQSYGAGLTRHLQGTSEQVAEVDHPHKRNRDERGKSDAIDAVGTARSIMGRKRRAAPRAFGSRDVLRVLMVARTGEVSTYTRAMARLRSLIVTAPQPLRDTLTARGRATLVSAVGALRAPKGDLDTRALIGALRLIAKRATDSKKQAKGLQVQIRERVMVMCPELLEQRGVGPISAAQILISLSHPGRIHSEAACARLAGIAPIPASSGKTNRYRRDTGGDRKLNSAIYTIAITRRGIDEHTPIYMARRTANGDSKREAMRALKRHIIRGLFRLVERSTIREDSAR